MNITQTIKNLKYNQRSPKISLIVENNNDEIKVKNISVQQGNLLEKNTMEENFLLDSQLHIVTSNIDVLMYKKNIEKELQKTYSDLLTADDEKILLISENLMDVDFINLFICTGLNIPYVKEIQLFFYKTFVIINSTFEDGTHQALLLVNILFNVENKEELDFVQKEIGKFVYSEEEAKESKGWADVNNFYDFIENSEKFSLYPYEVWYNNSLKLMENEMEDKQ